MLSSDMRESNEGGVRFEILTELGMRDVLEFIYTGRVKISDASNAQELILMADYLLLPNLKTLAEKIVVKNWNLNALKRYFILLLCSKISMQGNPCLIPKLHP